ncbi:MAG TPA: CaiB/BaiF CoA-transferase family protein [Dehalococcoidia bacterium]|nr:CaiB/BaiF CoA-transferase family protein [Dehalococcoidia bacterium]
MSGPLEGWRVLDLTQGIAGPYVTKLCSDYGADVLKVERPGVGDASRNIGPFPGDHPNVDASGMFLTLNTGKHSVTLNLKTKTGREILLRLAKEADLVVESFRAGTLERLDLAPERFAEANPSAALVRISNFGQTGPMRDFSADDLTAYAAAGILQVTGEPDREPVGLGIYTPLFLAGAIVAPMALAAMRAAHRDGQQEVVDFSIQEGLAGSMDRGGTNLVSFQYSGALMVERRERVLINSLPNGVFPCADGYIQVTTQVNWFDRFCRVIGRPEWITDPRMTSNLNNPLEIGGEVEAAFYEWLLPRTKQQAMEEAQAVGWPLSALNTPADVIRDPHFRERGFFVGIDHPQAGHIELPGLAVRFSDTPGEVRRPPLLGEHTFEVLAGLGYAPQEIAALRAESVI